MNKKILVIIMGLAIFGICSTSFADTIISSLPYTINSSGTYVVSSNLSIGSGTGITVKANNVVLYGAGSGKILTYAINGKGTGIYVASGVSNLAIYGLTLNQGNVYDKSVGIGGGSVTKSTIRDCVINVKSGSGAVGTGIVLKTSDSSSHIQDNIFNIRGVNRFYGIGPYNGAWQIHGNEFNVNNHSVTHCDTGSYPYVIYVDSNMVIYSNSFYIDGGKVNGIAAYGGRANVKIYDNTFDYNSSCGGRLIFPDGGTRGWEIYNNNIMVTTDGPDGQYIIRIRGTTGAGGSNNHKVHHNTIDASIASGTGNIYLISLGDNFPISGNQFYENILKGRSTLIDWYGSSENTSFSCNKIEHTGTSGYAVDFYNRTAANTVFSGNDFSTNRSDGYLVTIKSTDSSIKFCSDDLTSPQITGGGSVSISSAVCESISCSGVPIAELLPPKNLRILP